MNHKKELIIFLAVLVMILLYAFFVSVTMNRGGENQVQNTEVTEEDKTQLPADMPSDLPIEDGAVFTMNTVTEVGEGKIQSAIAFDSYGGVRENYDRYLTYVKEHTWTITNLSQTSTLSSIYGRNGNREINVVITAAHGDKEGTRSHVVISVLTSDI